MIWWGVICGALIGAVVPRGDWYWIPGAICGFLAGIALDSIVRTKIDKQVASLKAQIMELQALQRKAMQSQRDTQLTVANTVATAVAQQSQSQDNQVIQNAEQSALAMSPPVMRSNVDASTQSLEAQTSTQAELTSTEVAGADQGAATTAAASISAMQDQQPARSAPVSRPVEPPKPAEPSALDQLVNSAKQWLFGGNTFARLGSIIFFIGCAFILSFSINAGLIPIELRLVAVAAFGIGMLVFGFKSRISKPGFGLTMQGTGVAIMYLTIFAAFKRYELLQPMALAFGLMVVVCAFSCVLALLQNSRSLAVAAFAGGFAAPILLSTGGGSHIGLFSYYTVLNLAILFIATRRTWRILHIVGFIATFGVATAWGVLKYAPENYASAQIFLAVFIAIYVLTAIFYARNTSTKLGSLVDSILVFGTPLVGFGLQAGLVKTFDFGLAFSALGFGVFFLVLAFVLARAAIQTYRVLIECFLALGVGFATLAIPFGLDGRWTSAAWAVEGAGAFWVGMRQARWMPRSFGLVLQVVAAVLFLAALPQMQVSEYPLANPAFMGAMFIAIPMLMIAWWLRNDLPHSNSAMANNYAQLEKGLNYVVFLGGFAFWCLAWVLEAHRMAPSVSGTEVIHYQVIQPPTAGLLGLLAVFVSAAAAFAFGRKKGWSVAQWPSRISLPVMALFLIAHISAGHHVLYNPSWLLWSIVVVIHLWMLKQNDAIAVAQLQDNKDTLFNWNYMMHAGTAWWFMLFASNCLYMAIDRGQLWNSAWAAVVMLISAIATLLVLALWAGRAVGSLRALSWPLHPYARAYFWVAALPIACLVLLGAIVVAVHSNGNTKPLPYIPLLNPTDLTVIMAFSGLLIWRNVLMRTGQTLKGTAWVMSAAVRNFTLAAIFIAINTVWLRVAHHFFDVRWDAESLFHSPIVQTGYAILWTILAMALMLQGKRSASRPIWSVGAALLGFVVLKLFILDLGNASTRMIAFPVVGGLMWIVAYFAPIPPRTATVQGNESGDQKPQ